MAYEQKPNTGALFKNDEKRSENHPDYKGKINVAGVDYWISSWLKTSKGGDKYMSLSVTPIDRERKVTVGKPKDEPKAQEAFQDDDIPFN